MPGTLARLGNKAIRLHKINQYVQPHLAEIGRSAIHTTLGMGYLLSLPTLHAYRTENLNGGSWGYCSFRRSWGKMAHVSLLFESMLCFGLHIGLREEESDGLKGKVSIFLVTSS